MTAIFFRPQSVKSYVYCSVAVYYLDNGFNAIVVIQLMHLDQWQDSSNDSLSTNKGTWLFCAGNMLQDAKA